MCEASKPVSDLYCNKGVAYEAFAGEYSNVLSAGLTFDRDVNSPELIANKFRANVQQLFMFIFLGLLVVTL
jgi:hypothetical protein